MNLSLGQRLAIRAMVYLAGEPIASFWPMRTFIHHNPLHGLESLPFAEALCQGERLFHGRRFLPRSVYQRYLANGAIDENTLEAGIDRFLSERTVGSLAAATADVGLNLRELLRTLLCTIPEPVCSELELADASDVRAALHGQALPARAIDEAALRTRLQETFPPSTPLYLAVDALFGTEIADTLDELVIKTCLEFFDEGLSVWQMPLRELGLFRAWRELARRNRRLSLRGLSIRQILDLADTPEGLIHAVMQEMRVPENHWVAFFTSSLTRLHGWAGFIRWRQSAKRYYWRQRYPADLVDYLAVRLALALALLREHAQRRGTPGDLESLQAFIDQRPGEAYLRREYYLGRIAPALAHAVDDALSVGKRSRLTRLLSACLEVKRTQEASRQAAALRKLADRAGFSGSLQRLSAEAIADLLEILRAFEQAEGMIWLEAHEAHYLERLAAGLDLRPAPPRAKRPFAQLLFCIDVRSERLRRHLEAVGDYETYGVAGFFGIPVGFIGLEKGSETALCPAVLTPPNLVLELPLTSLASDPDFVSTLEHVLQDLKASLLSPYITVEVIGLLFGIDMFGKTLAPLAYSRWRKRLGAEPLSSRLLLDKLDRQRADSIVRSLQRAMIAAAVRREFGLPREAVTDDMIRELRETALGQRSGPTAFARALGLTPAQEADFVERLRTVYRVNRGFARLQLERLGRIGFTLDEQVHFVSQALRAIGLVAGHSRFVLVVGHGSTSENNPYESALDCGACGGNQGLVSARIFSQIANKPSVRERLRAHGIVVPDDTWFLPALHDTTTDEIRLYDLDLLPASHLVYLERLQNGLQAASRLCAAERIPSLISSARRVHHPERAHRYARRQACDWSQVRPEWGLARNAIFVIGRRYSTAGLDLAGRAFLHSYDFRHDPHGRLLANILSGPLIVAQWINMEHYFSTVDNERYGSGSKAYHNIAGLFGVMTGNLSDLRTGLPAQTVLREGEPYHEPLRLITVIEAPFEFARRTIESLANVRTLLRNGWIRMAIADPDTGRLFVHVDGTWRDRPLRHAPSLSLCDPLDQKVRQA
jgi:uncharacterized protein YbcC (UPF0753/DUF2309 family)